jgi:CRISP-associated protein Cas1
VKALERVVDITTDGQHLSVFRGFLVVEKDRQEVGRVPLDDVAAVIVHAHGITYSNNFFVALAERAVLVVICAANHAPVSCFWPLSGHHAQGARMRAQWGSGAPLAKQLWKQLVIAKIQMQAAILSANGQPHGALEKLAKSVRSGDPENIEAQAARRYWPLLFGEEFRRDRDAGGINAMLNYGYTVLRAITARAIIASGLHPTIGLHHHNRGNSFALADDLMEPFRPFVDQAVCRLLEQGTLDIEPISKRALAGLIAFDLDFADGTSPLGVAVLKTAQSLARSFEEGVNHLLLPIPPSPLTLAGIIPA